LMDFLLSKWMSSYQQSLKSDANRKKYIQVE
jgi:hypothetical protein